MFQHYESIWIDSFSSSQQLEETY